MTAQRDLDRAMERRIGALLDEVASPHVPDYFEAMIAGTVRAPQRRAWPTLPALPFRLALVPLVLLASALALLVWSLAIGSRQPPPVEIDSLLSRPWQATPLVVSPELAAAVDEACRPATGAVSRSMPRVLLDVRGGFSANAVYADTSGRMLCHVGVGADGELDASWTMPAEGDEMLPVNPMMGAETPPQYGFEGSAGSLRGYGEFAAGRISSPVERVDIVLRDGRRVSASVGGGWYIGWWPADDPFAAATGNAPIAFEPTLERVEGYDANGTLVTGVHGWLLPGYQPTP